MKEVHCTEETHFLLSLLLLSSSSQSSIYTVVLLMRCTALLVFRDDFSFAVFVLF
jgi:hypothetical protein